MPTVPIRDMMEVVTESYGGIAMSDNSTAPGEHPDFPAVSPARAGAPQEPPYAPQTQPAPPAAQPYPVQQYPGQQYPGQQSPTQQYPAPSYQGQAYQGQVYPMQPYPPARPTSGLAVTSLITGIGGILFSWTFVALLASIAAVITGHMALKQTRNNPALAGRGMAIAGLITGYVGVAIIALLVVVAIFSFLFLGSLPFLLYGISS